LNLSELIPPVRDLRFRWYAAALIAGLMVFRILYLLFLCPYDLLPDEAHYFHWSRHPDWSYYSKGPFVAWLIGAGDALFGPLAMAVHGTVMPAVRIPATLCGALTSIALYVLSYQTFRNDRLAFWSVLISTTLPATSLCSLLTTIDSPFLCFWAWALIFGRWAMIDGRWWAWPAAGLLCLFGILAKPTMALWLFSAGCFLLFDRERRRQLWKAPFWTMSFIAGLSALPILYWNSQHDWVMIKHVSVQAGVPTETKNQGIRFFGPLIYVATQAGIWLIFWFIAWAIPVVTQRPWKSGWKRHVGIEYLWWMSVPTFVVFGLTTFKSPGQPNWPVAAYISGLVLAFAYIHVVLNDQSTRINRIAKHFFRFAIVLGLGATLVIHDSRVLAPVVDPFIPEPTESNPTPARSGNPFARLKGWRYLATEVQEIARTIRDEEGVEPLIVMARWDHPGQLVAYMDGHPDVYSIGRLTGDRNSQYDVWHPNPLDDAQAFRGRTFLFVNGTPNLSDLQPAFGRVAVLGQIEYRDRGHPFYRWFVVRCDDFRGFDPELLKKRAPGH
jgi:Dolichyl-phosphate-mannose-protein mannosyltransferase